MKKSFRAAVATLFVLAFAVVGLSSVMSVTAADVPEFAEENLALAGTGFADSIYDDGNKGTQYLNDGKQDGTNYWQGQANDFDNYAGIYWAEAKTFNTVVVEWKHAADIDAYVGIEYATANAALADATTGGGRAYKTEGEGIVWKNDLVEDVDYDITRYDTGTAESPVDVITFNAPVTSQMVKVLVGGAFDSCGKNPAEIYEIEVYNVAVEEDEPATIGDGVVTAETAVVDGVKSVFVATNVAEADVPAGASIKASYTITVDGKTATGEELITAAYTSIALGEAELTAADINGADAADFVTGILFNNVPENATIEVVFTVAE